MTWLEEKNAPETSLTITAELLYFTPNKNSAWFGKVSSGTLEKQYIHLVHTDYIIDYGRVDYTINRTRYTRGLQQ